MTTLAITLASAALKNLSPSNLGQEAFAVVDRDNGGDGN